MSLRMSEDEYRQLIARRKENSSRTAETVGKRIGGCGAQRESVKRNAKYGNRKTEIDGITFDSKHESEVWKELGLRMRSGEFIGLARQVRFQLPAGIEYVADFVAFSKDGFCVMDAKSEATKKDKVYRLKKRMMLECLGIDIREV